MRLLILFLSIMFAQSAVSTPSSGQSLKHAKWKNRVLLIHAPDPNAKQNLAFQKHVKAHQEGIHDRDLIIISMDKSLRDRFTVPDNHFTLILIGKDGGEKARQTNQVNLEKLFTLIDGMPMRRAEMRKK